MHFRGSLRERFSKVVDYEISLIEAVGSDEEF